MSATPVLRLHMQPALSAVLSASLACGVAALATMAGPAWTAIPASATPVPRQYVCTLADGGRQMADRDLSREFSLAIVSCRASEAAAVPPASDAARDAASASTGGQYRCTLSDGSLQMADRDLAPIYPLAVKVCRPVANGSVPSVMVRSVADPVETLAVVPVAPRAERPATRRAASPEEVARLRKATAKPVASLVRAAAVRHGLDPDMVSALVYVESRYNPSARSPVGAIGLMQIMPATGARYGVKKPSDLLDPEVNIDVGTRYLRDLTRMFPGRRDLVLAAYNAGEGAVKKYGNRIPPYRETQNYVLQIMTLWGQQA